MLDFLWPVREWRWYCLVTYTKLLESQINNTGVALTDMVTAAGVKRAEGIAAGIAESSYEC